MKNLTTCSLAVALLAAPTIIAQQSSQPSLAQPTAQVQPCALPPAKPRSRGIHFHLPKKVQDEMNKEKADISKRTGMDMPSVSPGDLAKQARRPCPAPVAVTPPPNPKQ